ncbi:unnamed protein product, partial [Meganyctiphanes norvegica]
RKQDKDHQIPKVLSASKASSSPLSDKYNKKTPKKNEHESNADRKSNIREVSRDRKKYEHKDNKKEDEIKHTNHSKNVLNACSGETDEKRKEECMIIKKGKNLPKNKESKHRDNKKESKAQKNICLGEKDQKRKEECYAKEGVGKTTQDTETEMSPSKSTQKNGLTESKEWDSLEKSFAIPDTYQSLDPNGCCPYGTLQCGGVPALCLYGDLLCDGKDDCVDGEDEEEGLCAERQCEEQFRCSSGQCIDREKVCDGNIDCYDNSDENCTEAASCPSERS